ncbi:L,D-transpeptidase [Alkalihalobacterium bogoriense]|uniref:L,D-transpeptidase n=1 Tax=Alkalihalobacterium bogoriense TaxID=246272 RepID=UPI0006866A5C|nr:L,D-transpeptidase [Alkalihalobacterium bogoriense]
MFRLFLISLCFAVASPIWPIGQNPIVGDPFIIVNKMTNELAYIQDGEIQKVYSVATGKTEELTPEGTFTIVVKAVNPYYRKKNIEGGSNENPLGSRWIGFDALDTDGRTYGVHGTNRPSSIGSYVTAGCIRLQNKDVETLFDEVPLGTKITIINSMETFEHVGNQHGALKKRK